MEALIVDSFAGGGGASLGIEMALGRAPDVAINHDMAICFMRTFPTSGPTGSSPSWRSALGIHSRC